MKVVTKEKLEVKRRKREKTIKRKMVVMEIIMMAEMRIR